VRNAQMLYGGALSADLAVALVALLGRCRHTPVLVIAGVAAFLMPLAWSLILSGTRATGLFSHHRLSWPGCTVESGGDGGRRTPRPGPEARRRCVSQ
jgi:hypothetical protein